MRIRDSFAHRIREIENCWIDLSDGCRLAASVWLPEDAETSPVPAIFEFIPYRKRDYAALGDSQNYRYLAGHGYACARVDMRGSGDSDGDPDDQLRKQVDDALEVLRWLDSQPWCNGSIGMMGHSWGGQISLYTAARRPPELKAILTTGMTDDEYLNDIYYKSGCLLNDAIGWSSNMLGLNSRPPDPAIVGERWEEMWIARLNNTIPQIKYYLEHQRYDAYWKQFSVRSRYSDITCPVYVMGGWVDSIYANTVPRLLENLDVPRKGVVGPWAHKRPHWGVPGPAMGFLQEALRWFDHWLKGKDTGIMDEPMYRVWMQESVPSKAFYDVCPGRWVAEPSWPSPNIIPKRLVLNPGRLEDETATEVQLDYCSPQTVGLFSGDLMPWFAYGIGAELPSDQREEDGKSLCFDSTPLTEELEILGAPILILDLAVDRANAFVAVRLCDVAPNGGSARVCFGLLNLTHRDSHEDPELIEPGRRYRVQIRLNDVAYAFAAGHRLRVAVSTAYWPMVWPSPEPVTLSLFTGTSLLELPVRRPRPDDETLRPFDQPEIAEGIPFATLRPVKRERSIKRDIESGQTIISIIDDNGLYLLEHIGLEYGSTKNLQASIIEDNPLSARLDITWIWQLRRGDWQIRTATRTVMHATKDSFHAQIDLDAYRKDSRVFCRSWNLKVPREMV